MRKIILNIIFYMLLTGCAEIHGQGKNIQNYTFQKSTPAVSEQNNLKINMLVGRTIIGVSGTNKVILKANSFLNLEWQNNGDFFNETNKPPEVYSLGQNYPNPFNPVTRINYSIPEDSHVSLSIYNMLGEMVRQLIDEPVPAGSYTVEWDAREFTSGIYLYNLKTSNYSESKKLLLLK